MILREERLQRIQMATNVVARKLAQAISALQFFINKLMNNNSEQPVSTIAVRHKSNVLLVPTSVNNVTIVIIDQLFP
jgi:hypothetical protein